MLADMTKPQLEFDATALMRDAERAAGLDDWGGVNVFAPLESLCRALNGEAELTPLGRRFATSRIPLMLRNRLQLVNCRKHNPAIAEQKILKPIIVLGLPRTGTTLLFNLLAQDRGNRSPRCWEVMMPVPCPERDTYDTDVRISETQVLLEEWGLRNPALMAIHPFDARFAEECPSLCEQVMVGTPYAAFWNVPTYQRETAGIDREGIFREHRHLLQHLQWRCAGERWLLKSPSHLADLPSVSRIYPDAVYVQTHRDITRVLPSYASFYRAFRMLFCLDPTKADPNRVGEQISRRLAARLAAGAAHRKTKEGERLNFIDVLYADLIADPTSVVRSIYRRAGLTLSPETQTAMVRWLAQNQQGRHGRHGYSLAEIGINEDEVRHTFGGYMSEYSIPPEGAAHDRQAVK